MMPPSPAQRVEDLLRQMTLKEKASLLSGQDIWNTVPLARLGLPSLTLTDGPHGVRATPEAGRTSGPTTCFPTGVSMAASWNPALVERVGQALGDETRGMGCDILLGPCVNIVRAPLGGRNFESFAEDPYLAGRIGVAYVRGVQSRGVGTSLKHFACNNYEVERDRASSNVDERTLREIYLPAFEAVVKETRPWTVMCAYNRINGVYASQHAHLLNEILKDEWGFEGFVVSDWGANHEVYASLQGGLDLEMPGPAKYYGRLLMDALQRWQIDEAVIDAAVRRILRILLQSGRVDGAVGGGAVNTPEHQALARELAEEAITLLKNDGNLLPLDGSHLKSIAVIGPNAAEAVIEGGGSSHVDPPYRVSPLDALRARLGETVKLEYAQGGDNFDEPPAILLSWLTLPDGSGPGLKVEMFRNSDLSGDAAMAMAGLRSEMWWWVGAADKPEQDQFSGRMTGRLTVPEHGAYAFDLSHTGTCRVYLDDALLLENTAPPGVTFYGSFGAATAHKELQAGRAYALRLEFVKLPGQEMISFKLAAHLQRKPGEDTRLASAVELARRCDVALVFAGMPEGYETEGSDRPHMRLPGGQDALIEAVAQANPRTIVVLNAGSPVAMPWVDRVAAVVLAYYPGQENGNAVANVLLGQVNPSGKLPVTFPKRLEDNPAFANSPYPGAREVNYGEGVFVGYRYYDHKDVAPLFPFGMGLSYTTFEYSNLQVPASVRTGEAVPVSVSVRNSGHVAGKEVVQVYVSDPQSTLPRPPKELRGFAKVALQPGESQTLTFMLDARALSFFDPRRRQWVAEPGAFDVLVGSSSRDIRARATFTLQ
jgi:beta-glucosidase